MLQLPYDVSNSAGLAAVKIAVNLSTESKSEIAERIGISRQRLWQILDGDSLSDSLKVRLAEVFHFEPRLWFDAYQGPGTVADIEIKQSIPRYRPGPGRGHIGEPARSYSPGGGGNGDGGTPSADDVKVAAHLKVQRLKAHGRRRRTRPLTRPTEPR